MRTLRVLPQAISSWRTLLAAPLLLIASGADAGDYHRTEGIICSDCHAQHATQAGQPIGWEPGGPYPEMLVASSTNVLCLFCHDGSDPTAPDVFAPVTMYAGTGDETSAAGYFSEPTGTPSDLSHDLGGSTPIPLRTDGRVISLSCASCHAVHGNDSYRNLRTDPDSTAAEVLVRIDQEIFLGVRPAVPPDRAATIQAYRASNSGYQAGLTEWCTRCHDMLATDQPGQPPAHQRRHPGQGWIGETDAHVDLPHWEGGTGAGFGEATGDGVEGVPRVRFQTPGAASYAEARQVGPANEVFCTSCHLAHGGGFTRSLVWPYRDGGADDRSACNQCHNP